MKIKKLAMMTYQINGGEGRLSCLCKGRPWVLRYADAMGMRREREYKTLAEAKRDANEIFG